MFLVFGACPINLTQMYVHPNTWSQVLDQLHHRDENWRVDKSGRFAKWLPICQRAHQSLVHFMDSWRKGDQGWWQTLVATPWRATEKENSWNEEQTNMNQCEHRARIGGRHKWQSLTAKANEEGLQPYRK